MTRHWVSASNTPGVLDIEYLTEHDTWQAGWEHLVNKIERVFLDLMAERPSQDVLGRSVRFTEAREIMYSATENEPIMFTYEGRLWWLADLPVENEDSGEVRAGVSPPIRT